MPIAKSPKLYDVDCQDRNLVRTDDEAFAFRVLGRLEENNNGCWIWQGAVGAKHYGVITWGGHGNIWAVHRLVWMAANGPIPHGLQIDHLCNVPLCANPDHMEIVTLQVNVQRRDSRRRERG